MRFVVRHFEAEANFIDLVGTIAKVASSVTPTGTSNTVSNVTSNATSTTPPHSGNASATPTRSGNGTAVPDRPNTCDRQRNPYFTRDSFFEWQRRFGYLDM
eukprot:Gregarina_sp_Poly_1__4602@NODE_2466_length_2083_cov_163_687500_g1561_i0_p3_GENE_NODE_2466_length_2083_cov_163_687500_g1561_i0NODE_2466_length_2083_cov_163_687500_g1561_i0_p3_ORF_typecomplete_len101_score14_56_NODE_2466_length_2083_cov_163_687500_g1561_i0260562